MSDDAFLIPQTVFVGDEGRLVVPLAGELPAAGIVITDRLPFNENIIVKRVEIDVRAKQLLLDFAAFRPGVLEIPRLDMIGATDTTDINSTTDTIDINNTNNTIRGIGIIELPPLKVEIASILEREGYSIILSPPEKPLAAPGTFALITGGTAALAALVAMIVFLVIKGPERFHRVWEKVRVWLLIHKAKRMIFKTQNALATGRVGTKEGVAIIGAAFKSFLSAFYRKDYAAYSAEDFLLDAAFFGSNSGSGGAAYPIFAACDKFRFSPAPIESDAVKTLAEKTLSCIEGWA
ncbi:MAG: hypothetical protein LBK61_08545 [Spirochaetaceae bacterium]|jgi:hypothetical protein|nr:hypothetical protein [Spirochaetaceae bacterium]